MVHGATYNHLYWDFPVDYPFYSFVQRDLHAGRAALAYDRLGTGNSSRPPSTELTVASEAYVLHQVIIWARETAGFGTVDVIGHSYGSLIAMNEAASWPADPSRLVLTGIANEVPLALLASLQADFYPANQDPLFAGAGLDSGYLTTVPGARKGLFYSSAADPAVIAWDEAHRDVVSSTGLDQGITQVLGPAAGNVTESITAPVLLVDGADDAVLCGGVMTCTTSGIQAFEQPYFAAAASFTALAIPATGHDLPLHPTAGASFDAISAWEATTPPQ